MLSSRTALPQRSRTTFSGCAATTHWSAELAAIDPTIDVRRNERFVDDGDIVTSAGVSARIELALHLVARLAGDATARAVRRGIRYEPAGSRRRDV